MAAHEVLAQHASVLDGKDEIGAIGIHDVHVEVIGPPVGGHELLVLLGGVARTVVGSVALDDGAIDLLDHGAHELRMQVVLVALLAVVHLDGDLAG